MSEAAVLEEIRRLSETINRHKASQGLATRGAAPFARGGFRGRGRGRGALPQIHRNTSWVAPGLATASATPSSRPSPSPAPVLPPAGGFRNKVLVLNGTPSASSSGASTPVPATPVPKPPPTAPGSEVTIDGVVFVSDSRGNKLVRKAGSSSLLLAAPDSSTPKRASVSGTQYIRTKSGNLVSLDFARKRKDATDKRALEEKKERLDRLVGIVKGVQSAREDGGGGRGRGARGSGSGRGGSTRPALVRSTKLCRFFQKTGQCTKGLTCPYTHDSTRVAICPLSLRGLCPHSASTCPLSHTPNAHRSPHCTHFPSCNKGLACPYAHVHVSRDEPVCRAFVEIGWCEKGETCTERHVWECARFSEEGVCETRGCKLPHVLRRRNVEAEVGKGEEEEEEGQRVIVPRRKRRMEEREEGDAEHDEHDDEADDVKGISAHARRFKKGKQHAAEPADDVSNNADFVELFVPFSDVEAGDDDDDDEDDESVDSADLDEEDAAESETAEEAVVEAAPRVEAEDWRRGERSDVEEDDDEDEVERLLTR